MVSHVIEEVVYGTSDRVTQVKLFAIRDLGSVLNHLIQLLINVLDEVLSRCLEEEDLVVVVSVMAEIAALFTDQFIVDDAEGHILLQMVWAHLLVVGGLISGFGVSFVVPLVHGS